MRSAISGLIASALYMLVVATLLSMAIPTEARVQAYIDAAHQVTSSTPPADASLIG